MPRPIILPPPLRDGEGTEMGETATMCVPGALNLPIFDRFNGINSVEENAPNATVEDKTA